MTSSPEGALSLSELQDWMRLAVTTPGGLPAGLRLARERYGDARPIRVPEGADAGERLSIHARGYLERLLACLRADYPAALACARWHPHCLNPSAKHAPRRGSWRAS